MEDNARPRRIAAAAVGGGPTAAAAAVLLVLFAFVVIIAREQVLVDDKLLLVCEPLKAKLLAKAKQRETRRDLMIERRCIGRHPYKQK